MLNGFRQQQIAAASGSVADTVVLDRGEVKVQVVESGTIEAERVVELKSRAAGRLAKLLKDEGDQVAAGELIAVIDPTETRLQVDQNSAQLRGAQASVTRQDIEIRQRRHRTVRASQSEGLHRWNGGNFVRHKISFAFGLKQVFATRYSLPSVLF